MSPIFSDAKASEDFNLLDTINFNRVFMKRIGLFVLIIYLLLTCSSRNYVISPYKDKALVFEWNQSIHPNKKNYIKIFLSNSKKNYYSIHPISFIPIHVYWGDTIKIRGGILVDSNIVEPGIIDWKNDYTEFDQSQLSLNDTN